MRVFFRSLMYCLLILLAPALSRAVDTGPSPRYVATYFYTNVRCPSCLTIERWTSETLRQEFADEIAGGVLLWRTVNLDGEGNFHYVKDYNLYTKSVILSEMTGGEEVRWKNLAKVWELLRNEAGFRRYVRAEVRDFMERR